MKTINIYQVPFFLCNPNGFLKLRYLLGYMFDVALDQSFNVEDETLRNRYAWIIYSWDVEIIEPIKYKDEITVTTKTIGIRKFYAYRNYEIKKDGKTCIKAYSVFLLIDKNTKSIARIPKELEKAYGKEVSIYEGRKVSFDKSLDKTKTIQIRKSDMDINLHVNNAVYMDYLKDLIDVEDEEIEYFKIIYKMEIKDKEFILGKTKENQKENDFELLSEDGKVYTYGKMIKRNV